MVKDLRPHVSQLQGTDHHMRYNDLKAKLKAYCLAPVLLYLTSWLRPPKSRPIKLCVVSSRDPVSLSTSGDLPDHTRLGILALTVLDPVMPVGSRDILLGIAAANEKCNSNALSCYFMFK